MKKEAAALAAASPAAAPAAAGGSSSSSWGGWGGGWLSSAASAMPSTAALDSMSSMMSVTSMRASANAAAERLTAAMPPSMGAMSPNAINNLSSLREKVSAALPSVPSAAAMGLPAAPSVAKMSSLSSLAPSLPGGLPAALKDAALPSLPLLGKHMPSMTISMPSFDPTQWAGLSSAGQGGDASGFSAGDEGGGAAKSLTEAEHFAALLGAAEYEKAARFAANSPKQELRTLETIRLFQAAPPPEGTAKPPILAYFGQLLARKEPLRHEEGLALARPVAEQG